MYNKKECQIENIGNAQNFRYNMLNFSLFISIYIPLEYNKLKIYYKNLLSIFAKNFELNGLNYILIGIILMETINHFIVVFKNNNLLKNSKIMIGYIMMI